MKKIIYLDQKRLFQSPIIKSLLPNGFDWNLLETRAKFDYGMSSWVSRFGKEFMPFCTLAREYFDPDPCQYDQKFKSSFTQVTDQRCHDLLLAKSDRPWAVSWSGGIDSTVIVASLLKNLSKEDRSNVIIYCSPSSIAEYPLFYHKHIYPNFKVLDSSYIAPIVDSDCYYIDGEPGDQLFSHRYSRYLHSMDLGNKNWRTHSKELIGFVSQYSTKEFAEWLYDGMKFNIDSTVAPIADIKDWFWWLSFNFCWIPVRLRHLILYDSSCPVDIYLERMIHWFNSKEYQLWSFNNNHTGSKEGTTLAESKIAARRYIYDWTRDEYYYKYKTKTDSGSRVNPGNRHFLCILDDYSKLYVDTDLEEISELLPGYLKI